MKKIVCLLLFLMASLVTFAHGVQVAYTIMPNGFVRIYVEHWHGNLTTTNLVNNGMNITTTYGNTTVTQNLNPSGSINDTYLSNLPKGSVGINVLSTCPGSANIYNDWAYYDFAPAAFGVQVLITLNSGNTAVLIEACTQLYPVTISATFVDSSPPTITCPTPTASVACGVSGTNVNFVATATDNAGIASIVYSIAPGSFFPVGTTNVTATATDINGFQSSCTFPVVVKVVDNTPPTIICPSHIVVGNDNGKCGASIAITAATASDNCGMPTVVGIRNDGLGLNSDYPRGSTNITWTATDGGGNKTSCTQTVTVNDTQAPNAVAQNLNVFLNAQGNATITAAQINNGSSDNCGIPTLSIAPSSFNCSHVSGQSSAGNAMNFNGNYIDVPNDASLNPLNEWTLETWVKISASGIQHGLIEKYDCGGNYGYLLRVTGGNKILAGVTDGCSFGGAFVTGTTTISVGTWYHVSATFSRTGGVKLYVNGLLDGSTTVGAITISPSTGSLKIGARGNDANARLNGQMDEVRIWSVARTQQQIKASMNKSLSGSETGLQAYYRFEESATSTTVKDITPLTIANTGNIIGTATRVVSTADISHATPVTLTATDAYGNVSTTTAFVTVADNIPPTISCQQNISIIATSTEGSIVDYNTPVGTDNCNGSTTVRTGGLASGSTFPIGSTTVTHQVTDASGLTAQCSFTIKIIGEKPAIVCPSNIQVTTAPAQCGANVGFAATETVAIPASTITYSHNPESFFSVGNTTVTATATNVVGASACTFNIKVIDNQKPVITCPTPLSINTDLGICGAVATFDVTATDNCSAQVDFTSGLPSGSIFPVGTTENVYTATDASGNTSACSFTVTVKDNEKPAIKCPIDVMVNCQDDNISTSTGMASATDNCTSPTAITIDQLQTSTFSADVYNVLHYNYVITRTWQATDQAGNFSTCNQTITVQDITKPTISTVANAIVNCQDDHSSTATGKATGTDICSPVTITQSDVSTQGTNASLANYYNYTITRTWRATDVSGNFSESVQTITVEDVTKPTISTVANAIVNCQDDHSSTATGKATGTDICSPVTITQSDVSTQGTNASMANYYNYTVTRTWRATDVSGNFSESAQTITVQDVTKPLIICPIVANNKNTDSGLCTYSVVENEYNATASDNCSLQSLTYVLSGATTGTGSTLRGVKLYRGTTTVTWTAKDATGNTTICSFNVTVNDDQNPTSYIIYAKSEVKFGEYNFINGDIGVTAANGKASFKKYDVLNPYFVKAKNIDVVLPAEVTNRISIPATGGPNPILYSYNGNTASLSNYNVSGDMILSGNFKDLNIKKGIIVTIQGNNFGKISIEEGAQVTFSSSVLNIENLDIKAGKKGSIMTGVFFSQPTTVKIKDRVSIDNDSRINVGGPKVTFYLSDAKGDEEIFTVKGENTQVTANIIMPNGKLKVQGGDSRACIMTGWYIIDKLESTGKYITWNAYDCSMSKPALYKTNGKIFSNISAHMEEKRNAIPFMTNQGLETESWIAEKRNNITGEFEKLEMRNLNTDIKTALQSHTFYDNTPTEGDNFYRVKMMYANGNVVYSDIKKINNSKFNDFTVYPNPANKEAWVDLKSFEEQQVTLVLSDMTGKTLQQQVIEKAGTAPIHLDITNLQTGLYMVRIQAQGNRVMVRKIQIAK